ncbi:MAG: hypothetical protein RLZ55_801 [Actinomycetota bacterium]|jgi:hypothetical protein
MSMNNGHLDPETAALAALGESVDPRVEAHLGSCRECRDEVADLAAVVAAARAVTSDDQLIDPPRSIWRTIQAAVAQQFGQQDPVTAQVADLDARRRRSRARRGLVPLLAAAVVGVVIGGGLVVLLGAWQDAGPVVMATAPLGPLPSAAVADQSGTASVRMARGEETLSVATQDLADPQGFYEVWLLNPESGGMIAMGTVPGGSHRTELPLPPGVDLAAYRAVDISDEPFDGDPGHSAVSVLRGELAS